MKRLAYVTIAALCLAACGVAHAELTDAAPVVPTPDIAGFGSAALAVPTQMESTLPSKPSLAMYGLAGAGLLYRRWLDGRSAA